MIDKFSLVTERAGFALIMSLLVVSVVITAGLTILDVSIKQVRLSGSAKDSEIAFSATTAGLECGRYTRRVNRDQMENITSGTPDDTATIRCFDVNASPDSTPGGVDVSGVTGPGARAYVYNYQLSWGAGVDARCSKITTMVMLSGPTVTSSIALADMQPHFPGYPEGVVSKNCPPSGICTVLTSRGYNRSCSTLNSPGTIEREVLLEY